MTNVPGRVKGIVDVPELEGPVLLNAVQHTVHPPTHLPAWPRTWEREADGGAPRRGTRIVFIVRGLERERIERSLAAFRDSLGTAPAAPATSAPSPASSRPVQPLGERRLDQPERDSYLRGTAGAGARR